MTIKSKVKIIRGKDTSNIPQDLVNAVKKAVKKTESMAMIIDTTGMDDKQREQLVWLSLATTLDEQKCIKCGYEWLPRDVIMKYSKNGEPAWRDRHRKNPAYSIKGGVICRKCHKVKEK